MKCFSSRSLCTISPIRKVLQQLNNHGDRVQAHLHWHTQQYKQLPVLFWIGNAHHQRNTARVLVWRYVYVSVSLKTFASQHTVESTECEVIFLFFLSSFRRFSAHEENGRNMAVCMRGQATKEGARFDFASKHFDSSLSPNLSNHAEICYGLC